MLDSETGHGRHIPVAPESSELAEKLDSVNTIEREEGVCWGEYLRHRKARRSPPEARSGRRPREL